MKFISITLLALISSALTASAAPSSPNSRPATTTVSPSETSGSTVRRDQPNYDNYWVPLRAAMKRNLKLLQTQVDLLRRKFAQVTANSTSLEIALIDLQIQELADTIDKLSKQMDRTPPYIVLPNDSKPPVDPKPPVEPRPPIERPPTWPTGPSRPGPVPDPGIVDPAQPPITSPIIPPPERPSRPSPLPSRPPTMGPWSGMQPILAGYLTIDDGRERNAADKRFLGMDWFNPPSFSDFLGGFLR